MPQEQTYIPAPLKPEGFDEQVRQIGGTVSGNRPRYRFVWGMDEKEFFGGRERVKYVSIDPQERGMPRWICERWIPPGMFNPREWRDYQDVLGDYPSNGLYIFMFLHTDELGEYAQLNEQALARLRHDHMYLSNQRLEARDFAIQTEKREMARKRQEELREEQLKATWEDYFAHEKEYNQRPEYSFSNRITNPEIKEGETRTAAGIILPRGVSVK